MLCARSYYYVQFVWISGLARDNIPNLYFAKKPKQVLPYGYYYCLNLAACFEERVKIQ